MRPVYSTPWFDPIYDLISSDLIRSDAERFGSVRLNYVWPGKIRLVPCRLIWFNTSRFGLTRLNLVRFDSIWFDATQFGWNHQDLDRFDSIRFDPTRFNLTLKEKYLFIIIQTSCKKRSFIRPCTHGGIIGRWGILDDQGYLKDFLYNREFHHKECIKTVLYIYDFEI